LKAAVGKSTPKASIAATWPWGAAGGQAEQHPGSRKRTASMVR
jgi:hypothetical protein